jgi:hypothetical protein
MYAPGRPMNARAERELFPAGDPLSALPFVAGLESSVWSGDSD